MGMEFLVIVMAMLLVGLIIDYMNKASKENPQIFSVISVFFIVGMVVEYASMLYLGYDAITIIGQWTVGIWIFHMPIEAFLAYLSLPYLVMVIYYSYVKKE